MPLPRNDMSWPPNPSEAVAEWSAWYSGDPLELGTFYGARTGVQNHPNQLRGGVVGKVARWWWGQPVPPGEQSAKLHVPLAADICGTSADLLFSEPVRLIAPEGNTTLADFLAGLQDDGLDSRLSESAEVGAALGGVYLRTVWDQSVSPRPWTETAHPDGAIPTFRHGRLAEVSLWSELGSDGSKVYRLVEHHSVGLIEYALYVGTGTNLGKQIHVTEHADTEHLLLIPGIVEDGHTIQQPTLIDRLTVQYVPNMLPNRLHRNSPEGRSDLQGVTPLLDALDEAYSSWWRDIRHAKARIHVPSQYLDTAAPGSPGYVSLDREVYVPLEGVMSTGKDGLAMQVQQFAIRVEEHAHTCAEWTKTIIESAGYSTQSLSSGAGGAVTAAEVHSHERRSYMTRGKKIRYWTAALREHALVQALIANAHLRAGLKVDEVRVEFEDGVQESAASLAQTTQALRNAEAASTQTRVRMLHPDWDQTDVDDEVARILTESGHPVPTPDDAGF